MSSFHWQARVYWEDTDGGGVVYYANYLKFLERARTEWLRARGFSQSALAVDPGVVFAVVNVAVDYRQPAKLDDLLYISCEVAAEGAATMSFSQRITRGAPDGELLVTAEVRVACLDAQAFKPRRLPEALARELS